MRAACRLLSRPLTSRAPAVAHGWPQRPQTPQLDGGFKRFFCSTHAQAETHFNDAMGALREAYNKPDPEAPFDFQKLDHAMSLLEKAVSTDPEHGPAHGQLGLSLLHTGKSSVTKAADHMQTALGLMSIEDEGRTLVQMGYGDALFMIGMLEEAADLYVDLEALPSTQPADLPRILLRQYFVSLGLAQADKARAALERLPAHFGKEFEQGLQQLEEAISTAKDNKDAKKELEEAKLEIREASTTAFKATFRAF